MELVQIEPIPQAPAPKPEWLKARAPVGENYHDLKRLARSLDLNTVCESAHCPNIGECWHHKTATFMMLGNLCTRRCGFCAVPKGRPEPIDFDEPRRVAEAVARSAAPRRRHQRQSRRRPAGGARAFALVIEEIRRQAPAAGSKSSSPTFRATGGDCTVVSMPGPTGAQPQHRVRAAALSRGALRRAVRAHSRPVAGAKAAFPAGVTKTGVMVGLGEETAELLQVFRDLAAARCDILTIGQYLRPRATTCPWPGSTRRASLPS
jgi:lipoic acid synthetase